MRAAGRNAVVARTLWVVTKGLSTEAGSAQGVSNYFIVNQFKHSIMWNKENIWLNYVKNIIAADVTSAIFLAAFLRRNNMNKKYAASLEVIDLQRYKVIKKEYKVRAALNNALNMPFVFFVGKN